MGNKHETQQLKEELRTKVDIINKLEQHIQDIEFQSNKNKAKANDLEGKIVNTNKNESLLSEELINKFVNDLLKNPKINIKYFPDSAERMIYSNVVTLILEIFKETVEDLKINFLGHELCFYIQPKPNPKEN